MKVRSIIAAVAAVAACFVLAARGYAFENETNGFLGFTWGADISSFEGMREVRKSAKGDTICTRDGASPALGAIVLTDTLYSFAPDGGLASIIAVVKDYKDFLALKIALIERFGAVEDPLDEADEKYIWSGELTSIYLSYTKKTESGFLFAGASAKKTIEEY